MNILMILDYYGKMASANGICVEKVVDAFKKRGDRVSLLVFGECENTADDNVFCICQAGEDKKKNSALLYYAKWLSPTKYPSYERKKVTNELVSAAKKIIAEQAIDTVLCVHLPIEALVAGNILKKIFPHLRFVAYMLDSLSGGFLPQHLPKKYCFYRKLKWENRLLGAFDDVVLMRSSQAHHEKNSKEQAWYKKSVYLDIPLLVPTAPTTMCTSEVQTVTFVGTMADNVRTPYHFLKVLDKVKTKTQMVFAGNNMCGDLKALCTSDSVSLSERGILPHDDALSLLRQSHILLNLGNKNPHLVPSKIFEYMSMGKPIVSTYSADDDSCLPYLKKYGNALLLDERNEDIEGQASLLDAFIASCSQEDADIQRLCEVMSENTPEAFVDYIKSTAKA